MAGQFVSVKIGGEDRILRIDHNAIAEIEATFDRGINRLMEDLGIRLVREVIYQGIKTKSNQVSRMQVGRWMSDDPERGEEFLRAAANALSLCLNGKEINFDEIEPSGGDAGKAEPAEAAAE